MTQERSDLRVGDRIRLVAFPTEWDQPGYRAPRSTRKVYRRLIERRRPLRVYQVDEWGMPWVACRFRDPRGNWEYHWLAIDGDG